MMSRSSDDTHSTVFAARGDRVVSDDENPISSGGIESVCDPGELFFRLQQGDVRLAQVKATRRESS
jgi:hypothetical protein